MFVAPENQQPEVPKPQGFIAPENSTQDAPPLAQDKQPEGLAAQLVRKASGAALAPITAISKPIADAAMNFIAPENDPNNPDNDPNNPARANALEFERSEEYPPTGITSLSPTLDVMFAGQAAKQLGGLAAKGVAKGVSNVIKNRAEKSAIKDFIKSPKAVEGTPTTPIELQSVPKSAVGPEVGITTKQTARELPVITQEAIPTDKPVAVFRGSGFGGDFYDVYNSKLNSASNVRLTLSGEEGLKKIQSEGIEIIGKIPEAGNKQPKGLFTTESTPPTPPVQMELPQSKPKGIEFNKRQTKEIEKVLGKPLKSKEEVLDEAVGLRPLPEGFGTPEVRPAATPEFGMPLVPAKIKRMALDEMKEPIVPPARTINPRLTGSQQRIDKFKELVGTDIDPRNPLTSRVEFNKKLGGAEETASQQWIEGAKAENKAIESAIKDKQALYSATKIRPDTLESEALFTYIESPNKLEAYGRLAQAAGKEKADEILKAADNMRGTYDKLFAQVNITRKANGLPPIKYRQNYITHANEMNVLNDLGKLDLIDTPEGQALVEQVLKAGDDIARDQPNLYGRLKEVIFPYKQRKGGETSLDAVANFNRYVDTAHRYVQTQPYVNELLDTAKAIKDKAPNVAAYLENQANFIAGGKNIIDKGLEGMIDKDLLRIAQQLQNNAKGNVISLNPSVPVTQLFGLVPTAGKFPLKDSLSAAMNSFINPEFEKFAIANSPILQTRALGAAENDLMLGPVARQSARITNWFDYKVAEISWMAAFKDSISKGKPVAEAIQAGNDWAALSQAHLGRVSTPPMMQSKNIQAILPLMNQQIAYARSLLLHTLQGKTLTEKSIATTKMLILGTAVAAIKESITGTADHPLSPTSVLPFGGVLEHGAGGPLLNQTARLATAKSQDDFIRQLIRTGFLLQSKIPGGAIIGKQVENFFLGKKKKKN